MKDHKGDFRVAAQKAIGKEVEVDWSTIRVVCIAPGYKKYDLHAVKVMGCSEIELWKYKNYENGIFELEEVHRDLSIISNKKSVTNKQLDNGALGQVVNNTTDLVYDTDLHLHKASKNICDVFYSLQEKILSLDESIEEAPKKNYIAYKVAQNFVCIEVHKKEILVFLKINPEEVEVMPQNARSVKGIGHYGTGDLEVRVNQIGQIDDLMKLVEWSYHNING